jgi:phosphopantetheinyl transferase
VGSDGKPGLAGSPSLQFNLSHSGSVALYALSAAGPVGVDVEARPASSHRRDELALAARALGAGEAARLARLDPGARRREFLRAWTRHEAALKCSGSATAGEPAWVAELDLAASNPGVEGLAAAVALAQAPLQLRCYHWPAGQERGLWEESGR